MPIDILFLYLSFVGVSLRTPGLLHKIVRNGLSCRRVVVRKRN